MDLLGMENIIISNIITLGCKTLTRSHHGIKETELRGYNHWKPPIDVLSSPL